MDFVINKDIHGKPLRIKHLSPDPNPHEDGTPCFETAVDLYRYNPPMDLVLNLKEGFDLWTNQQSVMQEMHELFQIHAPQAITPNRKDPVLSACGDYALIQPLFADPIPT